MTAQICPSAPHKSSGPFAFHRVFILSLPLLLLMCRESAPTSPTPPSAVWVGTWGTAPQLVESSNMPPKPGLAGNTLRQIVCVSIGGERVRVRFSNHFGSEPVTIREAHIAVSAGGGAIYASTDRLLTFEGEEAVVIPPGNAVISDPLPFSLAPRAQVAISIFFGDVPADVTGHPGSRTTSYLAEGNQATAPDLSSATRTDHWYYIQGIDVEADESAAAVVVLGNSITDGRGSGTNKQNRWPDHLAIRLLSNPPTRQVAVLNMGIGGNCVLRGGLGPTALSRFERDVLGQNRVRWLIILEGINDIGTSQGPEGAAAVAEELIAAYEQMIDRAHAEGIRVYGGTLLPFGGSFYDTPEREQARQRVNTWIRTSGRFDAVIDFEAAIQDPDQPLRLLPKADSGDRLHPNETGHWLLGEAVDLSLFVD